MPISDVFSNFPQATVQHSPAMASTLARIAAQVHITANPSPRNIAESRQILSALQKFGEVITYRNLKVREPSSAACHQIDLLISLSSMTQAIPLPSQIVP